MRQPAISSVCVYVYEGEGLQSDEGGGQRAVKLMGNVGPIFFVRLKRTGISSRIELVPATFRILRKAPHSHEFNW